MVNRRRPPKDILEKLRREVNFGCPVEGCGLPYLMYHHFDPPWQEKKHHNPEGMIALCPTHHQQADANLWTKEQLKKIKENPFIKEEEVESKYDFLRKKTVTDMGAICYEVKNILTINGERVIGFNRDINGYDRLNLLIRNEKLKPILVMEDNFWTVYRKDIFDLRCSPDGKILEIISDDKETYLKMSYDNYKLSDFINYLEPHFEIEMINMFLLDTKFPEYYPVLKIRGKLKWEDKHIQFTDFLIEDLINENKFSSFFIVMKENGVNFYKGNKVSFG